MYTLLCKEAPAYPVKKMQKTKHKIQVLEWDGKVLVKLEYVRLFNLSINPC